MIKYSDKKAYTGERFALDGYSRFYAIVVAESWWQELDKSCSSHINSQERMNHECLGLFSISHVLYNLTQKLGMMP